MIYVLLYFKIKEQYFFYCRKAPVVASLEEIQETGGLLNIQA